MNNIDKNDSINSKNIEHHCSCDNNNNKKLNSHNTCNCGDNFDEENLNCTCENNFENFDDEKLDEFCDLDPTKICDNCCECLNQYNTDEKGCVKIAIESIQTDEKKLTLEELYKLYGLDED